MNSTPPYRDSKCGVCNRDAGTCAWNNPPPVNVSYGEVPVGGVQVWGVICVDSPLAAMRGNVILFLVPLVRRLCAVFRGSCGLEMEK